MRVLVIKGARSPTRGQFLKCSGELVAPAGEEDEQEDDEDEQQEDEDEEEHDRRTMRTSSKRTRMRRSTTEGTA